MSSIISHLPETLIAAGYSVGGAPREFSFAGAFAIGQPYHKRGTRPAGISRLVKNSPANADGSFNLMTYKDHGDDVVVVRLQA